MDRIKGFFKKAFLPITILFIPHSNLKQLSFKIPLFGVIISLVFFLITSATLLSVMIRKDEFQKMEKNVKYYEEQFKELDGAIRSIKESEKEFRKLFGLKNKGRILESLDTQPEGSLNINELEDQIEPTIETVKEIKKFLFTQRNIYLATPKGLPVNGVISSTFGMRKDPFSGKMEFHPALDIRAETGTPVKATADGVVSFSGWTRNGGNLVTLEHGFGFSTYYAHNQGITVKAGERIKRGEVIARVGATGSTTGPHSHYEIREAGKPVDPNLFLKSGR